MSLKNKILELRDKGFSYKRIKEVLGCNISTISYHCIRAGQGTTVEFIEPTDIEIIEWQNYYDICQSTYKVSEKFSRSRKVICKHIKIKTFQTLEERREKEKLRKRSERDILKQKSVAYKGGACEKCGYDKCFEALEFHHLDPNEKDFGIGGKILTWIKIKGELDKCILVCANCHREIHYGLKMNN